METTTIIAAVAIGFMVERIWEKRNLYRWRIKRCLRKKETEEERLARAERLKEEYPENIKVPSFEESMIEVLTSWGIDYRSLKQQGQSPSDSRNDDISE